MKLLSALEVSLYFNSKQRENEKLWSKMRHELKMDVSRKRGAIILLAALLHLLLYIVV